MPLELKEENVEGPMQGLPGGCEVQSGPEPAIKGKGATGSSSGGKSGKGSSEGSSKGSDNSGSYAPAPAPAPAPKAAAVVDDKKDGGVFAQ
ncbi:MAG: hypothetical protein L6R41_007055, partial [Letrouitia leprolyta]